MSIGRLLIEFHAFGLLYQEMPLDERLQAIRKRGLFFLPVLPPVPVILCSKRFVVYCYKGGFTPRPSLQISGPKQHKPYEHCYDRT